MLEHDCVRVDAGDSLSVTVLASHCQIQSELIRVDHVNVTRFGSTERVNSAVEGFVGAHLDRDSGVLAVDADWNDNYFRLVMMF